MRQLIYVWFLDRTVRIRFVFLFLFRNLEIDTDLELSKLKIYHDEASKMGAEEWINMNYDDMLKFHRPFLSLEDLSKCKNTFECYQKIIINVKKFKQFPKWDN